MQRFFLPLCLLALGLPLAGCRQPHPARQPAGHEPSSTATPGSSQDAPLLLEEETPLLLGDGTALGAAVEGGADNSRCAVCHLNLIQEELALTHAQADIGCADCHGVSDAHIADESWASGGNGTAPDIMFPKDRINPACLECHPQDKIPAEEHESLFAGTSQEKYCTDCHGDHLLVNRTCKWK